MTPLLPEIYLNLEVPAVLITVKYTENLEIEMISLPLEASQT